MKTKFWVIYLLVVTLLSGVAYIAISDDSDLPLTLSESEMAALQGATYTPGFQNSWCQYNGAEGCWKATCEEFLMGPKKSV